MSGIKDKIIKIPAKSISYGGTRPLNSIKYIVIHNTGNNNDTAKNNGNYFKNGNTRQAGAHYFIDREGVIVESISMDKTAYAVGGSKYPNCSSTGGGKFYRKCTNANSVSIELCDIVTKEPSDKQIKSTEELIKYIRSKCSNADAIIRHFDVNGKACPARMTKESVWKIFKKKIDGSTTLPKDKNTKTVTTDSLNVRDGAGTNHKIIDKLTKGKVVTILNNAKDSENNTWYYITYGNKKGYISAKYVK